MIDEDNHVIWIIDLKVEEILIEQMVRDSYGQIKYRYIEIVVNR